MLGGYHWPLGKVYGSREELRQDLRRARDDIERCQIIRNALKCEAGAVWLDQIGQEA